MVVQNEVDSRLDSRRDRDLHLPTGGGNVVMGWGVGRGVAAERCHEETIDELLDRGEASK
jgi:hypothetical protein